MIVFSETKLILWQIKPSVVLAKLLINVPVLIE